MLKKTLLALGLCLAVSASAFADFTEKEERGSRFSFTYPVFTLENSAVQNKINGEISAIVEETRSLLQNPDYLEVGTFFTLPLETEDYISFVFTSYVDGGGHGLPTIRGMVYDKATGNRLPYTHFTAPVETEQLKQGILSGKNIVYCNYFEEISKAPFLKTSETFKVSDNFILRPDGHVYLMYPPYELDNYAAGITYVQLP